MVKKFISISVFPGKTGYTYYNYYFNLLKINAAYQPLKCNNLLESIRFALNNDISGISVSMPYKKDVISFLDYADSLVVKYNSCNTVLIKDNKLYGYNTDFYGAENLKKYIDNHDVVILGNGCMANMIKDVLINYNCKLYARSLNNWNDRHIDNVSYINCTALGTSTEDSPFDNLPNTNLVIDLSLKPNNLKNQCFYKKVKYISGIEFYKVQFQKQFELYTGYKIENIITL